MVKSRNHYHKLARTMLWSLVTFISLLTHVVEIRPFFNSLYGAYYAGLLDGIIITIFVLVVGFYLASRIKLG